MPELYSRFAEYEKNVQLLAKKHGLMSSACSLEISLHASSIGQVHLHDYIGPMMTHNLNASDPRRVVDFDASDQFWDGMKAHVSASSAFGRRGSWKTNRVCVQAMYYVAFGKLGCVFRSCFPEPFQAIVMGAKMFLRAGFSREGS